MPPPPPRPRRPRPRAPSVGLPLGAERGENPLLERVGTAGALRLDAQHQEEALLELGLREAVPAALQVRRHLRGALDRQLFLEIVLQPVARLAAVDRVTHGAPPPFRAGMMPVSTAYSYSFAWSSRRPRNSRDLTVPTGMCSASAISAQLMPSMSLSTRTSRNSGGSASTASSTFSSTIWEKKAPSGSTSSMLR